MALTFADISRWQAGIDIAKYATAHKALIIKATEGEQFKDPEFVEHRDAARATNLAVVGFYHWMGRSYYNRLEDPIREADHFLAVVGPLQPGEFLTLDAEMDYGKTPDQLVTWIVTFMRRCADKTGLWPFLYTGQSFLWDKLKADESLVNYKLWIANYGTNTGSRTVNPRAPWQWVIHQYTSKGRATGYLHDIDLNYFAGEVDDLILHILAAPPADPADEVVVGLLKKGDSGPLVKQLQETLNLHSWTSQLGFTLVADGNFGQATEDAVKTFQYRAGLAVDGVCGPNTWLRLNGGPLPGRVKSYGWRELHSYFSFKLGQRAHAPTVGQSYGGTHSSTSYHYRNSNHPEAARPNGTDGCAIDYGHLNSDVNAIRDTVLLAGMDPATSLWYAIPEMILDHTRWRHGVPSHYAPNDHTGANRHIHIAILGDKQLP